MYDKCLLLQPLHLKVYGFFPGGKMALPFTEPADVLLPADTTLDLLEVKDGVGWFEVKEFEASGDGNVPLEPYRFCHPIDHITICSLIPPVNGDDRMRWSGDIGY